jgi:hypothetical protein
MSAGGGDQKSEAAQESGVETLPPPITGKARDKAGAAVGVSGRTMDKAKKVQEQVSPGTFLSYTTNS